MGGAVWQNGQFRFFKNRQIMVPLLSFAVGLGLVIWLYEAGGLHPYDGLPQGFHYGLNSPLDVLYLWMPAGMQSYGMQCLVLVRAALSGALLCWYFMRHYRTGSGMMAVLGAAYAANVYTVSAINVSWVDAAFLLPLQLDAIDRFLQGGNRRHLGIVTFCCVLANCYTSWPLYLFGGVYLSWCWLTRPGKMDWKGLLRQYGKFFPPVLAGGAAAILALGPVLVRYMNSDAVQFTNAVRPVTFQLTDLPYCLFFGRYSLSAANAGLPYIFCGVAVFAWALMYFFGKESTRNKLLSAFLLFGVAASYLLEMPGIQWVAAGQSIVMPYRYGFLLCALILLFAAQTLAQGGPGAAPVVAATVLGAILLICYPSSAGASFTRRRLMATAILWIFSCAGLLLRDERPAMRRGASWLMALLLLAELYASSCITLYGAFKIL